MPKCKLKCGKCCQYWTGAFTGKWEKYLDKIDNDDPIHYSYSNLILCPFLGPDGCKLLYEKRPKGCQDFLCLVSEKFNNKKINKKRALKQVRSKIYYP